MTTSGELRDYHREPQRIAQLLAACESPTEDEFGYCLLCGEPGNTFDKHADDCPWRLAREWADKHPEPEDKMSPFDLDELEATFLLMKERVGDELPWVDGALWMVERIRGLEVCAIARYHQLVAAGIEPSQ